MPTRYLHVSKPLVWDPKEKKMVLHRGGSTVRGQPVTQTLLKEAIWLAKQRRKKERKEAKRTLRK